MSDGNDKWRPVSEIAAEWFVRLKDGELTAAERREYLAWLKQSPQHIAEMLQISRTYGALRSAFNGAKTETLIPEEETSNIIDLATRDIVAPAREARSDTGRWKIAAAVAVVAIGSVLGLVVKTAFFDRTIHTEANEWRVVPLADGSIVRMGPRTRLTVEFADRQRFLYLQAGEAFFEVAKDPARPFIVSAELVDVRAVGTAFGVTRHDSEVTVTVDEGAVELSRGARNEAEPVGGAQRNSADESVPLSAGQQASVSHSWPVSARRVDLKRELAWLDKRLIFASNVDTVRSAVDEFNRRNKVQIVLDDAALAAKVISGVFDANDPESLVAHLEKNGQAIVLRNEPGILRLASAGAAP